METVLEFQQFETLAHRFKLLSEPTRLQILATICDRECSVQEICERTGLNQGNVSKHLRLLKDAGVVACRRVGIWRYYRVLDRELLILCDSVRHSQGVKNETVCE
jgi:DNA-binding transcriptional ArsR family regulator